MTTMSYPNRWGEGALFAYSGMDGETDWYNPFVASLMGDKIGMIFHTKSKLTLWCGVESEHMDVKTNIVLSDLIDVDVAMKGRSKGSIVLIFVNKDVVLGKTTSDYLPSITPTNEELISQKIITQSDEGEYTALVWDGDDNQIVFALAYDPTSDDTALLKAKKALNLNLDDEYQKKLRFYENLPKPEFDKKDDNFEKTYYKACSVLKVNIESAQNDLKYTWTTPDRIPHRNMWLWDSAFQALGLMYISSNVAEDTLKAVLSKQKSSGFIPHMMTPDPDLDSDVTQPPILSWAIWKLFEKHPNYDFLNYAYPRLKLFISWLLDNMDANCSGLMAWTKKNVPHCRCGESGMDNSPRFDFDGQDDAIDLSSFVVNEMELLAKMSGVLGIVQDQKMWESSRSKLLKRINENLWDSKTAFYYDRNSDNQFVRTKTIASFIPLFAGVANKNQAESLVEHLTNEREFWSAFPVASTARNEPTYSNDMWRGPTWINYNYLIIEGLRRYGYHDVAEKILFKTLEQISLWYNRTGLIFEYYDAEGNTKPSCLKRKGAVNGLNGDFGVVKDYNWCASIYIVLAMEKFGCSSQNPA